MLLGKQGLGNAIYMKACEAWLLFRGFNANKVVSQCIQQRLSCGLETKRFRSNSH